MADDPQASRLRLPLVQSVPSERADAACNRAKIIEAASRLVAAKGCAALSLDEVAKEARLGVGTVYRRFGGRASLLYTLLHEHEQEFQRAFLSGPPPLGPGAAPDERIRAFLHALVDYTSTHINLLLEAESSSPAARITSGPYRFYRWHLAILIEQVRPAADANYLADALLAPLSATLISHQLGSLAATTDSIKAGMDDLLGWSTVGSPRPAS
ncbi:MAG TPA: TetR/AcrR family transcriptional regulator [Kineosporiaceae bacterium]